MLNKQQIEKLEAQLHIIDVQIQTLARQRTLLAHQIDDQTPIKVGFLGPEGTYSHAAAYNYFGNEISACPVTTIEQIFREVDAGSVDYGVVPIENSSSGIVTATLDALILSPLIISAEIILPIHHNVLRSPQAAGEIKKVYAHEHSLTQCRHWLQARLPEIEYVPVSSNAVGAQMAAQDLNAAAIAGEIAVKFYPLQIVYENIEDNPQNKTRFLVIGKKKTLLTGKDKTSLLLSASHLPGALSKLLQVFADNNINVSLIESRPYQNRDWEYLFFIDIEGHRDDPIVSKALEELIKRSIMFTILGSYPRGAINSI